MSDDAHISGLRERLDALTRPSVVKVQSSLRAIHKSKSHAALGEAFAASGMSIGELATYLGVTKTYLHDMLNGRREVQDWVLRAMPREARLVVARGWLEDVEREPSSRTGTRG